MARSDLNFQFLSNKKSAPLGLRQPHIRETVGISLPNTAVHMDLSLQTNSIQIRSDHNARLATRLITRIKKLQLFLMSTLTGENKL